MKNIDLNTPSNGIITHMAVIQGINEANAASEQKQQFRHDWRLAIFNTVAGGIAGLITSIIFWLITK